MQRIWLQPNVTNEMSVIFYYLRIYWFIIWSEDLADKSNTCPVYEI